MNRKPAEAIWSLAIVWALVVPTLFFVARGAFSFDNVATNNSLDYEAGTVTCTGYGSTYARGEQVLIYGLACLLVAPVLPQIVKRVFDRNNRLLMLLPLLGVLSIAWSQDPLKSFVNIVPMLILTSFALYLAIRFSPERLIQFFLFIGVLALLSSFALVAFFPRAGIAQFDGKGAWQGLFVHKNQCAIVMTYLLVPAFCVQVRSTLQRIGQLSYILAVLSLIAMTQSRTGWLLVPCVLAFIGAMKLSNLVAFKEKIIFMIFGFTVSSVLILIGVMHFAEVSLLLGKSATMTGRTDIWRLIWPVLGKRPFFGFGYRAFWLGLRGESAGLELASGYTGLANAENAILQMWLELGGIGVLIMLAGIFAGCKDAFKCIMRRPSPAVLWWSTNVFLTVLTLIDGDKVMFPHTIEWVLYVVSFICLRSEVTALKRNKCESRNNADVLPQPLALVS